MVCSSGEGTGGAVTFETSWAGHPEFEAALTDLLVDWANTPDDAKPFPWDWTITWPIWAWEAYWRFKHRVGTNEFGRGLFGIDIDGEKPLGGWVAYYDNILADLHAGMVAP